MSSEIPDIQFLASCDQETFVNTINALSPESSREKLIKILKDNYFNSKDKILMPDDRYDYIVDQIIEEDVIGFPVEKGSVKLPRHMGSLNKIKTDKELQKYITGGERYTVSEKLDGMSCLYYNGDLYTRGDGDYGSKITSLISFLNLPPIPDSIMVRGELVVSNENFEKYKNDFATARSFMSGIVNASDKTIPERAKEMEFVAHELISDPPISISSQLKKLKKLGFTTVKHAIIETLNIEILNRALDILKSKSKFEIDGIVIQDSTDVYRRPDSGNPTYAFAYKKNIFARTTVIRVDWNVSKRQQIKPTIIVEPIILQGETVTCATGKNAKFIVDNNIGLGAIVSITLSGGVIPFIDRVIKGTTAQMPDIPFSWNETGVDLMVDSSFSGDEVEISIMENFFKELGIKYLGEQTVRKLYAGGYHSAIDIVHASELDLASVIGEGNAKRIRLQIDKVFGEGKEIDQASLMSASGHFGIGIGKKKIQLLLGEVPDILERKDFSDIEIKGIKEKTLRKFIEGIPKFNEFMKKLKSPLVLIHQPSNKTGPLSGKIFALSGFRDVKPLIEERGGKVSDKVTQLTTAVICIDTNNVTNKLKDAKKYGVRIITREEFLAEFI